VRESLKIKVGIYECEVKLVKDLHLEEVKADGVLTHADQVIEIDQDISPISKEVTLWHEIVHMIDRQYSLHLSERTTDCIAHGIVGVLTENKAVSFL
jgi:hypothetical protein